MNKLIISLFFVLLPFSSVFADAASDETSKAMALKPNLEAGKQTYALCASCHNDNGWGKEDGSFPVIAGQHRSVIIKQLADIRARNRENPTMFPFSGDDVLGGPQGMEDVAGYISQLPVNPNPGKGDGKQLALGKKIFEQQCAACHGKQGEGSAEAFYPRIQGQHYAYIKRQLQWIRDGRRKNANPAMLALIKGMDDDTFSAIADYVSRIPVTKSQLEIVNAKETFLSFWAGAKDKPLAEQKKLWMAKIESIDPIFYKDIVWGAHDNPDGWKKTRDKGLKKLFTLYSGYSPKSIADAYDLYGKTIKEALGIFKKRLPDYEDKVTVMIVPGILWGGSYIDNKNKEYLALGVDMHLSKLKEKTTIPTQRLIFHELFHDYHAQKRNLDQNFDIYLTKGKLFWQLWDEGMAIWGTGYVGQNQDASYVMMFDMSNYKTCHDSALATLFLKEIDNKAVDLKTPRNVKKWFGSKSDLPSIAKDLPPMIGYYLGWKVIRMIEKSGISADEFLTWDYKELKPHVVKALKSLAKGPVCKGISE